MYMFQSRDIGNAHLCFPGLQYFVITQFQSSHYITARMKIIFFVPFLLYSVKILMSNIMLLTLIKSINL